MPFNSDDVMDVQNSGMFVFPMTTSPASRNRRTKGSSALLTLSAKAFDE